MKIILDVIIENLPTILMTILTALGGYLGTLYKSKIKNETTQNIIKATVKYVEQVGKELGSEEKLALAKEKALDWLATKGIKISDTELEILVESFVQEFNKEKK